MSRKAAGAVLLLAAWVSACPPFPASVLAQPTPTARLVPVDGEPSMARVSGLSSDWTLRVTDSMGKNEQPLRIFEDVVSWGARAEPGVGTITILTDDSALVGGLLAMGKGKIKLGIDYESFSRDSVWEPIEIPMDRVRGVILRPPAGDIERDRLVRRISSAKGAEDVLLFTNGDRLTGTLVRTTIGATAINLVDAPDEQPTEKIILKSGGREIPILADRVVAVMFNPALAKTPSARTRRIMLGMRDGSYVAATTIRATERQVEVDTVGGVRLVAKPIHFWRGLSLIRPLGSDRVHYLSDERDLGFLHLPYLATKWPLGKDLNVRGGLLRVAGKAYAKGLGMHSAARIAYDLKGEYERFEADIAIDQAAGRQGSVTFRVFVDDGSGKFQEKYRSPIIRGGDKPQAVRVELRGATRMALLVDFADRGDVLDHANWLNARLIARP